jgi:hypothetical protein
MAAVAGHLEREKNQDDDYDNADAGADPKIQT